VSGEGGGRSETAPTDPTPPSNRDTQDATFDRLVCERCAVPIKAGRRFCSRACFFATLHANRPKHPPLSDDEVAEMRTALAELRASVEEVT
jgi:hypothetical protein